MEAPKHTVVDRLGALFKFAADFGVGPTPFVNLFAVCLYISPPNLGLRPDIIQLRDGLIEMYVGKQACVARERMPPSLKKHPTLV